MLQYFLIQINYHEQKMQEYIDLRKKTNYHSIFNDTILSNCAIGVEAVFLIASITLLIFHYFSKVTFDTKAEIAVYVIVILNYFSQLCLFAFTAYRNVKEIKSETLIIRPDYKYLIYSFDTINIILIVSLLVLLSNVNTQFNKPFILFVIISPTSKFLLRIINNFQCDYTNSSDWRSFKSKEEIRIFKFVTDNSTVYEMGLVQREFDVDYNKFVEKNRLAVEAEEQNQLRKEEAERMRNRPIPPKIPLRIPDEEIADIQTSDSEQPGLNQNQLFGVQPHKYHQITN